VAAECHRRAWFGFRPPLLGLLIAIFVLVFLPISALRLTSGRHRRGRSALDTLDERFARGEIDRADYEERRKLLSR
jgi:putative membrane protein